MSLDLEPEEKVIDLAYGFNRGYQITIENWPYHAEQIRETVARRLVYRINAESFAEAHAFAKVALETVAAMRRVWQTRIVEITEWSRR